MIVMLPPSEGKTPPRDGPVLDLSKLFLPELSANRETVLGKLEDLCNGPIEPSLEALGISERLSDEVSRNSRLRSAPCGPAIEIYTGVLYSELADVLTNEATRERACDRFAISSALWGILRPEDPIPAYRLSIGSSLAGIGNLASWWRPRLTEVLGDSGFLVDLRSAAYAAAWRAEGWDVASVGCVRAMADGSRKTVSHMAKAARGRVARAIAHSAAEPNDASELADLLRDAGEEVELTAQAATGRSVVTIIET